MTARPGQPSRAGTVPWPDELVDRYVAAGYWDGRPLGAYPFPTADATPDAVALTDGDLRLTYRQLVERVDSAATRLRGIGLRPDDRILVQLPNGWEHIVLTLACLRLGVIPVMALLSHRRRELSHLAEQAEARAIAVPDVAKDFDHRAMAHAIARESPGLDHVLVAGGRVDAGSVDLRALCRPADGDPADLRRELDRHAPDSRSVAFLLLSGGTTGLPKLIARTHDDFGCMIRHLAAVSGFGPEMVYLAALPLGHAWPLGGSLATLRAGGRVVVTGSPAPPHALATIARERVTHTAVVPAVVQRWLDHRDSDRSHDLSSMYALTVGGSRLPDEIAPRIVPTLARVLQQGYGMTEGLVCLTRPDDPDEVVWHTQGRPICDGDELRIVDEAGAPVPAGEPGVLLARGPCITRGYYRGGEHNALAFVDGWLRSGDIVRLGPGGNLVVEGRDKDVINRGGEKVSAEEVENLAYQVAGVKLAGAVSMPDPELGERVCLYVVPRPGGTVTLAQVQAVMRRAEVAAYKLPERLVLVDSLPTTTLGKIDKKALRDDIRDRLTAPADRA